MNLEHPELPSFEPLLLKCNILAHTSGLQALSGAGKKLDEIKTSKGAHRRFIRGCHYGFDLAQRRVAEVVIELERQVRELEAQLAIKRRERDLGVRDLLRKIKTLQARQLVFRRLIDSVLWTMLSPTKDDWALRHMSVDNKIRRIEPDSLRRTLETAVAKNKAERLKFNIVCDLTTAAQVGDLIEVDRSDPSKSAWRVIELKTGQMNEVLTRILDEKNGNLSQGDWAEMQTKLGERAVQQTRRKLRQRSRQSELKKIVESDKGISPEYNRPVSLFDSRPRGGFESDALGSLFSSICKLSSIWQKVTESGCLG